jgi:signal transduction histidine kinase/CheY-like chemotaxis protein
MRKNRSILFFSFLLFAVLVAATVTLCHVISKASGEEIRESATELATETGDWFSQELDLAILPLFTMAQFATEIEIFSDLPDEIGPASGPGSLPFLPSEEGPLRRNITGVCDQPELVNRFTEIAASVKTNAKMDGILHNIQLAPEGVICLLHPVVNTEDFDDGTVLDNHGAFGIDLLNDSFQKYIARASLKGEEIGIAGPRTLTQCSDCGLYFIARLPVRTNKHTIVVEGERYEHRWGFATALINWDILVSRAGILEHFEESGFEFRLTRTDRNFNDKTRVYDEDVVVLAESRGFGSKPNKVSTALQTTDNEWVITVEYDNEDKYTPLILTVSILVAFCIASLVYIILIQKQKHAAMLGTTMAQEATVEIERNMTAYYSHELRNPLNAIDCALASMPDDLSEEARELVVGCQICSSFMSNIMNNLLDVRKIEEGKMVLHTAPLSLSRLVEDVRKMLLPSARAGVDVLVIADTEGRDWILGDMHRLQQVLSNIVSNAIKYTITGSVTIVAGWEGDSVRLECRDTGPGIPKDEQEDMFSRFTTRGGAPGSGLGLAIAKQIVDLMDGSIRFDSDPTVRPGTNCIVTLPLQICKQPEEAETNPEDSIPLEEPLSILLIDDIKMNRAMVKRRLQKNVAPNCTITEASTGEEALNICETETFDVIVVDQYMEEAGGVMVGTDVVIAMRRSKIGSIIIGCSGNDLDEKFLAAGADLVWKKPMPSNTEIIRQLRQQLANTKSQA